MGLETVVILAAGEGTRMKSSTPKVLHSISGRSLVGHVLHAVDALAAKQVRVVVGAGREQVEAHLSEIAPHVTTVFQEKRGGTGHATQLALADLKASGTILVLAGDTPMLTGGSLQQLLDEHHAGGFTASVLTAEHPDPLAMDALFVGMMTHYCASLKSAMQMKFSAISLKLILVSMHSTQQSSAPLLAS